MLGAAERNDDRKVACRPCACFVPGHEERDVARRFPEDSLELAVEGGGGEQGGRAVDDEEVDVLLGGEPYDVRAPGVSREGRCSGGHARCGERCAALFKECRRFLELVIGVDERGDDDLPPRASRERLRNR